MPVSSSEWTLSPVVVRVAAIRLTMTSRLISGLPRQFWVIREKRRCSILFHLLVPGGKWQTAMLGIATDIVNPVGVGSAEFRNQEIVDPHLFRIPFRAQFLAAVLE